MEGSKVICDLAKPRLLQPDIVAAISAFGAMGRIQNVKNNPMHSSRQEPRRRLRAEPKTGLERRRDGRS
jgi:hypothetical protein